MTIESARAAIIERLTTLGINEATAKAEFSFFLNILKSNSDLAACTFESQGSQFCNAVVSGLSFNPLKGHVYVQSRSKEVGGQWIKVMEITETVRAKAERKSTAGAFHKIIGGCVVWDGDHIEVKDGFVIAHEPNLSREYGEGKVLGAYITVQMSEDGELLKPFFTKARIGEWKHAAIKQGTRGKTGEKKAAIIADIEEKYRQEGFVITKCIKHFIERSYGTSGEVYEAPASAPTPVMTAAGFAPTQRSFNEDTGEVYEAPASAPTSKPTPASAPAPTPVGEQEAPF
jgi:hypothetical protein